MRKVCSFCGFDMDEHQVASFCFPSEGETRTLNTCLSCSIVMIETALESVIPNAETTIKDVWFNIAVTRP